MSEPEFDPANWIETAAPALGLSITQEQRPGVETFLQVAFNLSWILEAAPLPDDNLDQAPVFVPGAPAKDKAS